MIPTLQELHLMMTMRDEALAGILALLLGKPAADLYRLNISNSDMLVERAREEDL